MYVCIYSYIHIAVDLMGVALLRLGNGQEALETFEKAVYIYEQSSGIPMLVGLFCS